jgi:hypothetical protein
MGTYPALPIRPREQLTGSAKVGLVAAVGKAFFYHPTVKSNLAVALQRASVPAGRGFRWKPEIATLADLLGIQSVEGGK